MSKDFLDNMALGQDGQPLKIDARTMEVYGPDYDYSTLTTVFPRFEGEEEYTVLPRLKALGVGAYRNGKKVPEKETEKKA